MGIKCFFDIDVYLSHSWLPYGFIYGKVKKLSDITLCIPLDGDCVEKEKNKINGFK